MISKRQPNSPHAKSLNVSLISQHSIYVRLGRPSLKTNLQKQRIRSVRTIIVAFLRDEGVGWRSAEKSSHL